MVPVKMFQYLWSLFEGGQSLLRFVCSFQVKFNFSIVNIFQSSIMTSNYWSIKWTIKKLYGPFSWMGFNCLMATEPLQGDYLLFTTKKASFKLCQTLTLYFVLHFLHCIMNLKIILNVILLKNTSTKLFLLLMIKTDYCFDWLPWTSMWNSY